MEQQKKKESASGLGVLLIIVIAIAAGAYLVLRGSTGSWKRATPAMAILTMSLGVMIAFAVVPLGNQVPYCGVGSAIVLQIPIHATDAKIIDVTFHLPRGFRLYQLSPYQAAIIQVA